MPPSVADRVAGPANRLWRCRLCPRRSYRRRNRSPYKPQASKPGFADGGAAPATIAALRSRKHPRPGSPTAALPPPQSQALQAASAQDGSALVADPERAPAPTSSPAKRLDADEVAMFTNRGIDYKERRLSGGATFAGARGQRRSSECCPDACSTFDPLFLPQLRPNGIEPDVRRPAAGMRRPLNSGQTTPRSGSQNLSELGRSVIPTKLIEALGAAASCSVMPSCASSSNAACRMPGARYRRHITKCLDAATVAATSPLPWSHCRSCCLLTCAASSRRSTCFMLARNAGRILRINHHRAYRRPEHRRCRK